VRRGHEVHLVTYHFGENINCEGLNIHRIPELFKYNKFRSGPEIRKPILDLLLSWKLNQVVKQQNIQIIHCHNYEAPLAAFPVRFLHKIPVVYHSHNTMSDEFYTYFRLKVPQILAKLAAYLMDRFIPRKADFIIAINRHVADFVIRMGSSPEKVKYIPPGIDYKVPDKVLESEIRDEYNLGKGKLIIYAGNLDGYQRMDLLLQSLPPVFRHLPEAKLVVITSSDHTSLLQSAKRLNLGNNIAVISNPTFSQTRELFKIGAVAVNSRISWSGFPIKLLNYMAAGLPIVAFEGAAPAIQNNSNGILVSAGDTTVFGEKILEILESQTVSHRLSQNAKETVSRFYNWEEIVKYIEIVYAELLNIEIISDQVDEESLRHLAAVV